MEDPQLKIYTTKERSEPIADSILNLLIKEKLSYFESIEALKIAKDKLLFTYPEI